MFWHNVGVRTKTDEEAATDNLHLAGLLCRAMTASRGSERVMLIVLSILSRFHYITDLDSAEVCLVPDEIDTTSLLL